MAKITLTDITSGYNLSALNNNFQEIEDQLNSNVLYRNNPDSESANTMANDLDMNDNAIINLPEPTDSTSPVRLQDLEDALEGSFEIAGYVTDSDLDTALTDYSTNTVLTATYPTYTYLAENYTTTEDLESTYSTTAELEAVYEQISEEVNETYPLKTDIKVKGDWASLTGSIDTGYSVYHDNMLWSATTDITDITATEPAKDNTDWTPLLESANVFDTMADLLAFGEGLYEGQRVSVTGFHGGYTKGSGSFVWTTDVDKASHNGGFIIDPTHTADIADNWTTAYADWLVAENTGAGVWYRVTEDRTSIRPVWYGATLDGNYTAADLAIMAAVWNALNQGNIVMDDGEVDLGSTALVVTDRTKPIKWDFSRCELTTVTDFVYLPGIVVGSFGDYNSLSSHVDGEDDSGSSHYFRRQATNTAGTEGYVTSNVSVNTTTAATSENFEWGLLSVLNNYTEDVGENVAVYGQGRKYATGPTWAGVMEARDYTETTPTHGLIGVEVDVFANGSDRASAIARVGVDIVGGKGVDTGDQCEVGAALRWGPQDGDDTNAYFRSGLVAKGDHTEAVIDLREATNETNGYGIYLPDDMYIKLGETGDFKLAYSTTDGVAGFSGGTVYSEGGYGVVIDTPVWLGSATIQYTTADSAIVASDTFVTRGNLNTEGDIRMLDDNGLYLSSDDTSYLTYDSANDGIRAYATLFSVEGTLIAQDGISMAADTNLAFPSSANSTSATAGSISIPGNLAGFITVSVGGTLVKVPYFGV